MKQLLSKKVFIIIFIIFLVSRLFVLANPPYSKKKGGYSDVKHDYERYANIWWYGLPPYLKHLFEYPPATIPLIIFPLFLDQKGIGKFYPNYRFQIFVIDLLFFFCLVKFLKKIKIEKIQKLTALAFYIISGLIAKDFLYDGIDFIFSSVFVLILIIFFLLDQKKTLNRLLFWIMFWLSVGIKLITFPLLFIFSLVKLKSLKRELITLIVGFLIVWGLPLIIFRSSLLVIFVYNFSRSFKYSSFPYLIADSINAFTKTELKIDLAPDFSLTGPYSVIILSIFNKLLPLCVVLTILYSLYLFLKYKKRNDFLLLLKMSLIYVLVFYLSSKIYSQPFPIWLIPLGSIALFYNKKRQIIFYLLICFLLIIDTTNLLNLREFGYKIFIYPLNFNFLRGVIKFLVITALLILSLKIPIENRKLANH